MILKQLVLGGAMLMALSLTSCSEDQSANTGAAGADATLVNTNEAAPGTQSAPGAQAPASITPSAGQAVQAAGSPTAQAAKTAPGSGKIEPGMNPQHGQPGHRCDIPVGAPLSTPVTKKEGSAAQMPQQANAPAQKTINVTSPAAGAQGAATGKVNPPHGQPGHDCAVAVGAPLK